MENDLTNFRLSQSPERNRRIEEAGRILWGAVSGFSTQAAEAVNKHNRSRYAKWGNTVFVLALGIGWLASPVTGLLVGVPMGLFGLLARFATRPEGQLLVRDLALQSKRLKELWAEHYAPDEED